jgi:hypothetical protein
MIVAKPTPCAPLTGHSRMTATFDFLEREYRRRPGRWHISRSVHQHDGSERWKQMPDFLNLLQLQLRGDNREARAGIVKDVFRLRGRQRGIDRNRYRTAGQDREVAE